MLTLRLILQILALACLGAASLNVMAPRVNLLALGLFLWTLAILVPL